MTAPLFALPSAPDLDWSDGATEGTYRCDMGWNDDSDTSHCCRKRATTQTDEGLFCTEHALLNELRLTRLAAEQSAEAAVDTVAVLSDLVESQWRVGPIRGAWFALGNLFRRVREHRTEQAYINAAVQERGSENE